METENPSSLTSTVFIEHLLCDINGFFLVFARDYSFNGIHFLSSLCEALETDTCKKLTVDRKGL